MNKKYGIAHRLLAAFLALVLVCSTVPAAALSVSAEPLTSYGTVSTYTGGTVSGSGTQNVTVVVEETTLEWSSSPEGWWVGIAVTAPEDIPQEELDNATYRTDSGSGFGDPKSFATYRDGDRYIQLWFPVTPESLDKFETEGRNLTLTYEFNWNGQEDYDQTITFSVVPSDKIVLKKDGVQHHPGISGVDIMATPWTYDGEEHALVSVSAQEGDVVTYKLGDGEVTENVPTAVDAGTYSVTVYVSRDGFATQERVVNVAVEKAAIKNISLNAAELAYTGENQALVTLSGVLENDVISWTVNGEAADSSDIPQRLAVGTYKVDLTVSRGENYQDLTISVDAEIKPGSIDLGDLVVRGVSTVYNGEKQPAVIIENADSNYTLLYQIAEVVEGQPVVDESAWTDKIPTVTDAGSYVVLVKAVQTNYNTEDVEVTPAEAAVTPYNVFVDKAPQSLKFVEGAYNNQDSENSIIYGTQVYNFAVEKVAFEGNEVVYSYGQGTDTDIVEFAGTELTVTDAGTVVIVASLAGNENYHEASIAYTLYVTEGHSEENPLVSFEKDAVEYIFGEEQGIESLEAEKRHEADNDPVYALSNTEIGLAIDGTTGEITVADFEKLGTALAANDGELQVTVVATKATKAGDSHTLYEAGEATYVLTVKFMETPESTYVLRGDKGTIDGEETGWYVSAVKATAADDAYSISKTLLPEDFAEAVEFSNQGDAERYVYLRNKDTGGITAAIPVQIAIDTEMGKPSISYSTAPRDAVLESLTLGFYNAPVVVTIELTDETSGVDHFDYTYAVQEGASQTNVGGSGTISESEIQYQDGKATASFTINPQFRGCVTVEATDKAGNTAVTADDKVIVVDTIAPGITVSYEDEGVSNGKYYNADRTATITIEEANFVAEDLVITVEKTLNDGTYTKENMTPAFEKNGDEYTAKIVFGEDADYTFAMEYTDCFGEVYSYEADEFTVDLTNPVIDVEFDNDTYINDNQFKADRTATVTVTEHNFDATAFVVTVNGEAKELEWTHAGDIHTTTVTFNTDAHYVLNLECEDLAGRTAQEGPIEFTVDKEAPINLAVSYSESVMDAFLENLTFGFYNPDVTVTIEAEDLISGVDYFEYTYAVQDGTSEISDTISGTDITYGGNKATASFKIEPQFRGLVSFKVTDKAGNTAVTADDTVIVVDTIAPGITVSYEDEGVSNGKYYNADRTATITIKEANFFEADLADGNLVITVEKTLNNGKYTKENMMPVFEKNGDEYTAKIVFGEDADYTFDIKYTDRAGNVYDDYEMDEFTIDKILPEISVSYKDEVQARNDKFYADDRTMVITVEEHNFRASDVNFNISATDVTGEKTVDLTQKDYAAYLKNQNNWVKDKEKDIWTAEIVLDIEGNYEIGMTYADLAGNAQADAFADDFCIDKSVPTELTVSYSEHASSAIWEALTFGFYKAPVVVTITAADEYAGVDYFDYSYDVQAGASEVNAGGNGTIESDDIIYEGNKATATFEIPAQYRGHVSFEVTDKAGNDAEITAEEVVVVDNKAPVIKVEYDNNDALYTNYYDGNRKATITITEANFFADDQKDGYLVITVTKTQNDGTPTTEILQPEFTSKGDVHTATIDFTENVDYKLEVAYTDRSGNVAAPYVDSFAVDKIAPVIEVSYDNDSAKNEDQFKEARTATIVITEHNFNAADVVAEVTANGEVVESYAAYLADDASWTHKGDVHTAVIKYTKEAHYTFDIAYADMAGNKNEGVDYGKSVAPAKFTLDTTAPTGLTITIDEVSVLDTDNSVTFDTFYKEQVAVKLDANCDISGLESLQYQKVSAVNQYQVNGEWTAYDADKGIVVSPSEKFVIFFRAEDKAGNVSIVNSTGIVVDNKEPTGETKAPEIDILLPAPNDNGFYKSDVVVNLKAIDPGYIGLTADKSGFYSGLNKITYRVYTTDTNAIAEGVLLDLADVTEGAVYDGDNLVSSWSGEITINAEEFNSNNVIVEITAIDNAGNSRSTQTKAGEIQIDATAPKINISYNINNPDSGSYYNADRIATVTIEERNFDAKDVVINITNADDVNAENPAVISDWTKTEGTGNNDNTTYTATIVYAADGDYEFSIAYTDLVGWTCGNVQGNTYDNDVVFAPNTNNATAFTIDKTNPVIRVAYNNNQAENGKYFDATRTATVTITEHNFDVTRVIFDRDAARGGVNPNVAWTNNGDVHTATLNYTADGDYTFDVTMTDMAGNASGAADFGNSVAGKDFVVDTTFEEMIQIGGVENGKAYGYNASVIPTVDISDINLENYTVTLVGVQKDTTIDLTDKVNALLNAGAENVTGSFDIFEVIQDMDGIYTLSVKSQDKAGNQDAEEVVFTVNRFGSVYVYGEYLMELIANGGAYVQRVTEDLVIDEYNADKLISDSLVIEITCDGKPLENVIYEVTPEINDTVDTGESGWYQYKYTISKDNFLSDGVYKIAISTEDATGNTPENSNYEDLGITFYVDATVAEISSIVGLEEAIINATEQVVKFTIFDTMGIKRVLVYVDGTLVDEVTDFTADRNNYSGSFTLAEQTHAQSVRIVVEDMAGNITDTDAETFSSAYEFNRAVTVSTNIFVRWYANKPLFWGSIGGVVVLSGGLWFALAAKNKKKEQMEAAAK